MSKCRTITEAVEGIHDLDELESFSACLRDPPPGVTVKDVTEREWRMIAHRKIELSRRGMK